MQDIKSAVHKFLLDNFLMGDDIVIAEQASFMKERILDSSGFMELVMFLEDTYGIKVGDAELLPENLDSLTNVDAFVRRKQSSAAQHA
jgi:acyl carrier protein